MFCKRIGYDFVNCRKNAVNRMSGGKRLFLASLQPTCNEYLYLNINKSKLAFLLQKSSGDFWVIWLMFSIFSMFSMYSMLPMFSKLTPCSPIRDGRMEQLVEPCWIIVVLFNAIIYWFRCIILIVSQKTKITRITSEFMSCTLKQNGHINAIANEVFPT